MLKPSKWTRFSVKHYRVISPLYRLKSPIYLLQSLIRFDFDFEHCFLPENLSTNRVHNFIAQFNYENVF